MTAGRVRAIAAAAGTLAALLAAWALGPETETDGLAFDIAVAFRAKFVKAEPADRVVVLALDRKSLESEELAPLPRVFLGPHWARTIEHLDQAGAQIIAFDFLFQYSANRFLPGHDRSFLAALADHKEKIVLARSPRGLPPPAFVGALGGEGAFGLADLAADEDGVQRKGRANFADRDGKLYPSFAAQILGRAGQKMPERLAIVPARPLDEAIPSVSLIDLLRCAEDSEGPTALTEIFDGKIVLIGSVLEEEDQKTAADRFLRRRGVPADSRADSRADSGPDEECSFPPAASDTRSVAGVFVHAALVEAAMNGKGAIPAGRWTVALIAAAAALASLGGGLFLSAARSALALSVGLIGLFLLSAYALGLGLWLPPVLAMGAALGAWALAQALRAFGEEGRARRIQRAFAHYLAPVLVARLAEGETLPVLGGETRDITVMFADLSGFTKLSGELTPQALMEITNRYLGLIVQAVEAKGGYVDKFIGDAVMAIWGAPAADPDHARHGIEAALAAVQAIDKEAAADRARGRNAYSVKIALNSGPAVVGNVGARGRFNYTAVGETVNLAARLEIVPPLYGVAILAAEGTVERLGEGIALVELDWVRVKGREKPLAIFTPQGDIPAEEHREALALYRNRKFAKAAEIWRGLGPACAKLAERAEALAKTPPRNWDGVSKVGKE